MRAFLAAAVISLLCVSIHATASVHLVDDTTCLDGSNAGYYYRAAADGYSKKWVIFLEGGGFCVTQDSCTSRAKTQLGSSKDWPDTLELSGISGADSSTNSDFYQYNSVYVPYCTGDVHSGTVKKPTEEQWGLYFTGHTNLVTIVEELVSKYGMGDAEELILTGSSAGGLGTFLHTNAFFDAFPNTRVTALPQAGWFLPLPAYDPSVAPCGGMLKLMESLYKLAHSYLPPDCVSANPDTPHVCFSANYTYPHIKAPLFVFEMQYDINQLYEEDSVPLKVFNSTTCDYIGHFGDEMRGTLQAVVNNKRDGLFNPGCFGHGVSWNGNPVGNVEASKAFGDWYFQRAGNQRVYADSCPNSDGSFPCNPTCGYPTGVCGV